MDAVDGNGTEPLAPRVYSPANITVTDDWEVKGLSVEQGVALFSATALGSQYYIDLLAVGENATDDDNSNTTGYTEEELALVTDEDLKPIVEKYAEDEAALMEAFVSGWTYLMTADRFKVRLFSMNCDGIVFLGRMDAVLVAVTLPKNVFKIVISPTTVVILYTVCSFVPSDSKTTHDLFPNRTIAKMRALV